MALSPQGWLPLYGASLSGFNPLWAAKALLLGYQDLLTRINTVQSLLGCDGSFCPPEHARALSEIYQIQSPTGKEGFFAYHTSRITQQAVGSKPFRASLFWEAFALCESGLLLTAFRVKPHLEHAESLNSKSAFVEMLARRSRGTKGRPSSHPASGASAPVAAGVEAQKRCRSQKRGPNPPPFLMFALSAPV